MTKVSCSENETEDDYGDTYTYSSSLTATLTWSKGNLTKVVIKEDGTDDGDKYSSTDTYVYEYGNEVNEYKQPLMALSEVYENFGDYSDLMFIGYFGIGTSYLPTSVEERYVYSDDEEDEDETWSWEASYTTNSNGTIKTEKFVDTYTYAYYTLSTRSATPSEQVYNSSEETSRHINPLKHHHGHHMHE
ncbi:MAG: hypothetical protein LUC24_01100 [Bacteroidales bacterium]|nr:hypothetical protein [Bacteroidales bacterium]